jgi:hypothetical protein
LAARFYSIYLCRGAKKPRFKHLTTGKRLADEPCTLFGFTTPQDLTAMNVPPVSLLDIIDATADAADSIASDRLEAQASRPEVLQTAKRLVQDAGAGTAPTTATLDVPRQDSAVATRSPSPVELTVRDVNGDGAGDAVVKDLATGARAALLSRGGGEIDAEAVSLSAPQTADLDRLSLSGTTSTRRFLAADFNGDGNRQFAVKTDQGYVSLGSANDGTNISDAQAGPGLAEAELRFGRLIGYVCAIVPGLELGQKASRDGAPAYMGYVQMPNGNVDPNPLNAFTFNSDDIEKYTIMDASGAIVSAFDPLGVGIRLYAEEDAAPAANADAASAGPRKEPTKQKT